MRFRNLLMLPAMAAIAACAPDSSTAGAESVDGHPVVAAEAALDALVEEGFAGSVLVACQDRVVLHGDYGLPPQDGAVTRYWVASVSKGLTAIAVLKLAEEGRLNLTDTIAQYYPNAPAEKKDTTLFQLLTHQSGLPQNYASEGIEDRDEAAAAILAQPLNQSPGVKFGYSNDNYSLAATIIELASGEPYKDVIKKVIADPLNIESVAFWPDDQRAGETTPPLLNPFADTGADIDWGFLGGHGARLSVEEIYKIGMGAQESMLIDAESRALLIGPHLYSSRGLGVGMGWFVEETEDGRIMRWMRGSDQSGGNALFYSIGENGLAIAAATNAGPDEEAGPGWSRRARDAMMTVFAPTGAEDFCAVSARDP